jgi:hypothetical protein
MASLRFCSRILERPGEAPKSPFDGNGSSVWSRGGNTSPTSQMSRSTTGSEQQRRHQRQIMMEQFDPKYYSTLLRNVTADPRQRFNRASSQPFRSSAYLGSTMPHGDRETYNPPNYMDIDPGVQPWDSVEEKGINEPPVAPEFSLPSLLTTPTPQTEMGAAIGTETTSETEKIHSKSMNFPGGDSESLDAEMDALSLELRRGSVVRQDADTPSDSLMDKLSQELLHHEVVDHLPPSPRIYRDQNADPSFQEFEHVLLPYTPNDTAIERQPSYEGPLQVSSSLTSEPHMPHLDVSIYQTSTGFPSNIVEGTDSGGHGHPDEYLDNTQERLTEPRQRQPSLGYDLEQMHDRNSTNQSHYIPPIDHTARHNLVRPRSNVDPPSQHGEESSAVDTQRTDDSDGGKGTESVASPSDSKAHRDDSAVVHVTNDFFGELALDDPNDNDDSSCNILRTDSPILLSSGGSQTGVETEEIESLLQDVKEKSRSSSPTSISKDLQLIRKRQKAIIRRLMSERDSARKDVNAQQMEMRKKSSRLEEEMRDLRQQLDAVKGERTEFEQIAEDAVSGRESLEHRVRELEKALRKKQDESVSRNDYLFLQNELDRMKQLLEEKTNRLEKLQKELLEQTAEVSRLQMELQDLELEKRNIDSRWQQERSTTDRVQAKNAEIQLELESLRSQVILIENERSVIESQLEAAKKSLQASLEQKGTFAKQMQEQISDLQMKLQESQSILWEKDKIAGQLKTQLQDRDATIAKLEEHTIRGLQSEIEKLRESKDAVSEELSARLSDTKDLTEELLTLADERQMLQNRLTELQNEKEQAEATLLEVEHETTLFKQEAERRIQSFLDRHDENEAQRKSQDQALLKLETEKRELQKLLEGVRGEHKAASATVENLRGKLEELTRSRSTLEEHEQRELQSLRQTKDDLLAQAQALREQLTEREQEDRAARLRTEAETSAWYNAQREQFAKERNETERDLRKQMEEKLAHVEAEGMKRLHREVEQARIESLKEAEASFQRRLEAQRQEMQQDFQARLQQKVEHEREGLQTKAYGEIQNLLHRERRQLRLASNKELQDRMTAERNRLKQEADATLRAKLRIGLEKLQAEAENSIKETLASERERLQAEALERAQSQMNLEMEQMRAEYEEELRRQVAEERTTIQAQARESARREWQASLVQREDRGYPQMLRDVGDMSPDGYRPDSYRPSYPHPRSRPRSLEPAPDRLGSDKDPSQNFLDASHLYKTWRNNDKGASEIFHARTRRRMHDRDLY